MYLSSRVSLPVLGAVAAGMMVPGFAALWINEPPVAPAQGYGTTLREMADEFRRTFVSRRSLPGMLLLVSPIGTGAVMTVMTGYSTQYGASATQVAFANGWGGGLVTAAGSMCILLMPARWNRMIPYVLGSTIYAGVCFAFAAGPVRPLTFICGILASTFVQGMCWGAYTGLILQTMDIAGRFQSGRYTVLNSIGNMPVAYMVWLCGRAAGRFGPHGVGILDGTLNALSAAAFFTWWALRKRSEATGELPVLLTQA